MMICASESSSRIAKFSVQTGVALVTALVFLFVLTMVSVIAMQSTSFEYRMSTNAAFKSRACEVSESGRMAVSSVMPEHAYLRSWSGMSLPSDLTVKDKNEDGTGDALYGDNDESAGSLDLNNLTALTTDAVYKRDVNGDGDADDLDLVAAIKVFHSTTKIQKGSGTAMLGGYQGLGKALGAGGAGLYYVVASEGKAPAKACCLSSTDVRTRVVN